MKRIAFPTGLLLVVMLVGWVTLRARAQDESAKPILPPDPPVPTLNPDAIDPVSPTDLPRIDPPPLETPLPDALPLRELSDVGPPAASNAADPYHQPHSADQPTETSIATVQVVLQQIGLKPITVGDELFCNFKTAYNNRDWKFSISAKVPKDSQTVELYAWLNKYPAEPSDAETLQARALKINDQQLFDDAILPHEFRFRDHRLTLRRVLNAKDCEQTKRLMREIQTLARMVAANYSLWSKIGTPILSQSADMEATSDAIDPVSCQPVGPPNLTPPAGDGSLSDVDPAHGQLFDDKFFATDSTLSSSDPDPQAALMLKIVSLRTLVANDAVSTLQQVFGDSPAIIAADVRSNSVILRGREHELQELIALLEQLDGAKSPEPKRTKSLRLRSKEEVRLEKQALSLKAQLDEEAARSADRKPADSDARVKDLIQQIRSAVDESFNERQRQQLTEIEELTIRLSKLAKVVRERETKREAIIEQRLSQLIGKSIPEQSEGGVSGRRSGMGLSRGMGVNSTGGMGMSGGNRSDSSDSAGNPRGMGVEDRSPNLNHIRTDLAEKSVAGAASFGADASQNRILTDLAAKGLSLRNSILQNMELIPAFRESISSNEATPGVPKDGLAFTYKHTQQRLAIATHALQQEREECSLYLQLLRIEYEAAKAEHERTTQKLDRIRTLYKQGDILSQAVTAAEAAHAKSNAAVQSLGVLMKLFLDIERLKTLDERETPPANPKPDDVAPENEPRPGR